MKALAIFLLIIVIAVWGIYTEISLWSECRETNSFFYCARVLGSK